MIISTKVFKKYSLFTVATCFILTSCEKQNPKEKVQSKISEDVKEYTITPTSEGHGLIIEMVKAIGGKERLYDLKDVEFTYDYRSLSHKLNDLSTERYMFKDEISWARYDDRNKIMPHKKGLVIQCFDGEHAWVSIDGKKSDDPSDINLADFMRKTNFYWITMMHKLLDDGIVYTKLEDQMVDDQNYHRVKIEFNKAVGDVQDTYVVYINPKTKLVDQFLFTVMTFNKKDPLLMIAEYETIKGVKLMTHRKYRASNWNGDATTDFWEGETFSKDFKFNNGFKAEDFAFSEKWRVSF